VRVDASAQPVPAPYARFAPNESAASGAAADFATASALATALRERLDRRQQDLDVREALLRQRAEALDVLSRAIDDRRRRLMVELAAVDRCHRLLQPDADPGPRQHC
jgi:hypothetical protein